MGIVAHFLALLLCLVYSKQLAWISLQAGGMASFPESAAQLCICSNNNKHHTQTSSEVARSC